jgi:hypothetical protein
MALALVACLTAAPLPAAEPLPVSIGSRVRAYSSGTVVYGTLLAYGPEGLTIETRQGRDAITLGLERVERLQVEHGRSTLGGLFSGALFGLLLGIVAGLLEVHHVARNGDCEFCGLAVPAYAILGIPVGALVGAAAAPPAWHDASLPPLPEARKQGLGFRVLPVRGGTGIALTYAF